MKPLIKYKPVFVCPHCNEHEFSYGQLCKPRDKPETYIWFCEDCASNIHFTMTLNNEVDVTAIVTPEHPMALVLLRFEPEEGYESKKPFYLIIEMPNYPHCKTIEEFSEHQTYFYNEGTCPANYLGNNIVLYGDDDDPHGLFQFIEAIWMPGGFDEINFHNEGGSYRDLFKSMV